MFFLLPRLVTPIEWTESSDRILGFAQRVEPKNGRCWMGQVDQDVVTVVVAKWGNECIGWIGGVQLRVIETDYIDLIRV